MTVDIVEVVARKLWEARGRDPLLVFGHNLESWECALPGEIETAKRLARTAILALAENVTEEMVVAAARVICRGHDKDPDRLYVDRHGRTQDYLGWEAHIGDATAALQAALRAARG